jgi:heme exporter protein D
MSNKIDRSEMDKSSGDSSGKWREFLTHLGIYVIVIGGLGAINFLTDPGGYPWVVWPALGWGVGIAFHIFSNLLSELEEKMSNKWHGFLSHVGSYAIIMALLISIYLMTNPGGYPWFVWPAFGWGIALAIHLWTALLEKEKSPGEKKARRRRKGQAAKEAHQAPVDLETVQPADEGPLAGTSIQAHLDRARLYKEQIEAMTRSAADRNTHLRLQELANQVDEWTQAVETLARRVAAFQKNRLIHQDLTSVPQAIKNLEDQLAGETDPATRAELEQTLTARKNQLAALQQLQNMMKRAEIKIESTLSSLGTLYSQVLTSQSTDHVADYSRLSAEVDEEVRTLQDHLEALEEVKMDRL